MFQQDTDARYHSVYSSDKNILQGIPGRVFEPRRLDHHRSDLQNMVRTCLYQVWVASVPRDIAQKQNCYRHSNDPSDMAFRSRLFVHHRNNTQQGMERSCRYLL